MEDLRAVLAVAKLFLGLPATARAPQACVHNIQDFATPFSEESAMRLNHAWVSAAVVLVAGALAGAALGQEQRSSQQPKSFEKEITVKVKLNYLLFLPEGYESSDKKWPLILFLHGGGIGIYTSPGAA